MKRWLANCPQVLLVLGVLLVAGVPIVLADGYIITDVVDPSSIMSEQKAVIIHDDGREDLIISVGLALQPEQHPQEWAWIIPVPSRPEVNATTHYIFATLDLCGHAHLALCQRVRDPGCPTGLVLL